MINNIDNANFDFQPKFFSPGSLIARDFPIFAKDIALPGATKFTSTQIESMLVNGQKVANDILNSPDSSIPHKTSAKDAQNLLWFLTACACQNAGSSFHRGVIRLHPLTEHQSLRLRTFFSNCKEANAHSRPSSHFKGMSIGSQKGLDFDKATLPFDQNLSTVLCGRLKDNSFFVKFEREGVSWKNPVAGARHMMHWVTHAMSGGGHTKIGGKETRRETDGQSEVKQAFEAIVDARHIKGRAKKKELKSHSRIFQMFNKVEGLKTELNELETARKSKGNSHRSITDVKAAIEEFDKVMEHISNKDVISGKEVLLDISKYLP